LYAYKALVGKDRATAEAEEKTWSDEEMSEDEEEMSDDDDEMSEDDDEMSDEEKATGTEGATGAIEFEDEKKPEVDEEKKPEADVEGSETSVTVRNVERLSCDGCSTTFDSKALLLAHEGGCVQYQVKIALAAQEKKHRAEMLKQEKGL
jgi:hypothetical protein